MNGAQQEKNEARPVKALIHGNRAKILPRGSDGPYGALVVRTSTGDAGGKVSVLRKLPDGFDTQRLIGAATPAISHIGVSFFRQQSSQKGNRTFLLRLCIGAAVLEQFVEPEQDRQFSLIGVVEGYGNMISRFAYPLLKRLVKEIAVLFEEGFKQSERPRSIRRLFLQVVKYNFYLISSIAIKLVGAFINRQPFFPDLFFNGADFRGRDMAIGSRDGIHEVTQSPVKCQPFLIRVHSFIFIGHHKGTKILFYIIC